MTRILVTGAGGSAASNFINSLRLAAESFYIVGTDSSPYHLELADVDARYLLPRADDPTYLDKLNLIVEAESVELVHPQPDPEVFVLSRDEQKLQSRTFLPRHETVALCQDKAAAAEATAAAGVPAPSSRAVGSETDLAEATGEILSSHERAWVRARRGAGARASLPVTEVDQAVSWARYWVEVHGLEFGDFMVSQFLPGREYAFQSLWQDGELITSATRERLQYIFGHLTPSGQTSSPSVARSVHEPAVNEIAARCIAAIDPRATGVFCADLKEDETGHPLLTEINAGRFFTTSNFFATAGANMPLSYVRLALGWELGELPRFDAVEADLYWVRMMDMGFKLVRAGEWLSTRPRS